MNKLRVLFLCTGNSARSQMAEGLVNHFLGDAWEAVSAGVKPAREVHPLAVKVMAELGVDISQQYPKKVDEFRNADLDLVITVCDQAAKQCPAWIGKGQVVHIGFPDPAAADGGEEGKLQIFRQVRDGIQQQVLEYLKDWEAPAGRSFTTPASLPLTTKQDGTMTRKTFDKELQALQDEMLALGSLVENALVNAVDCLKRRDFEGSKRLMAQDRIINEKRYTIEDEILTLIALRQPMAGDLRILSAILAIISELERIGDYAKGIAKVNLRIGDQPLIKPIIDLPIMAEKSRSMLHRALDAFIQRDVELARAIPKEDDEVDALYEQTYRELVTYILSNPKTIEQANQLLWAAHNLERAADRVTNLCERVVFTVTGELEELD